VFPPLCFITGKTAFEKSFTKTVEIYFLQPFPPACFLKLIQVLSSNGLMLEDFLETD